MRVSRTLPAGCRSRRKIAGPRRSPLPRKADHAKHVAKNVRRCRRLTSPPGQMEANGVQPGQVEIAEEALRDIIQYYTREAGVRNLEREIGKTLRHAAVRIAEGQTGQIEIARENLADILGAPQFESELAMRTSVPGVATGLAWTPVGGDILFIEATRAPGSGRLILTGQLGEVMRESAQAALSIVKNRAGSFGIEATALRRPRQPDEPDAFEQARCALPVLCVARDFAESQGRGRYPSAREIRRRHVWVLMEV